MRVNQRQAFLLDVVRDVTEGGLAVAGFQRPYVWDAAQVEALFESLLRRWPIGSFVVWEPSPEVDMDAVSRGRVGPISSSGGARALLLDGQNRLASFAWAVGLADTASDDAVWSPAERSVWMSGNVLVADYDERRIMFAPAANAHARHRLPFGELVASTLGHRRSLDSVGRLVAAGADDRAIDWLFDEVAAAVREARTVVTTLEGADAAEAKEAFLHICRAGQPISEEDFNAAVGWTAKGPRR